MLPEDEEAYEDMPDDMNVEEEDSMESEELIELDKKSAKSAKVVTEQ
jgi:hypothetical protein